MIEAPSIVVLKFGSSVLKTASDLDLAVEEIYRWRRQAKSVVAVVSAFQGRTDALYQEAARMLQIRSTALLADHVAQGERECARALVLALARSGIAADWAQPQDLGLLAEGPILDAHPVSIDVDETREKLASSGVLVVLGFVGWHRSGSTALFGRGGSDLSALFLAHRLQAEHCILIKDTSGVFERDPNLAGERPRRYAKLSFHDALAIDGRVIQQKALHFAVINRLTFSVRAAGESAGSLISAEPTRLEDCPPDLPPVRVALYGHGHVGSVLRQRLQARPDRWQLVGVCVHNPERHRESLQDLMVTDVLQLRERAADVVVEVIGGSGLAGEIIEAAIDQSQAVVTANKEIMAERGEVLIQEANLAGVQLRFGAAVGGALPVLEQLAILQQDRRIVAIEAILNGSSNHVLDSLSAGLSWHEARKRAQEAGLCEADPSADFEGRDALRKLVIISRLLFGREPDRVVLGPGIRGEEKERGCKQIATLRAHEGEIVAAVKLRRDERREFVACHGAANVVWIEDCSGRTSVLKGLGAGGEPTTEALLADLLDLRREAAARAAESRQR